MRAQRSNQVVFRIWLVFRVSAMRRWEKKEKGPFLPFVSLFLSLSRSHRTIASSCLSVLYAPGPKAPARAEGSTTRTLLPSCFPRHLSSHSQRSFLPVLRTTVRSQWDPPKRRQLPQKTGATRYIIILLYCHHHRLLFLLLHYLLACPRRASSR